MGKFDKLNQELVRVNNAQGGPNAAALDDRFQLLNNTLVNTQQEWEDYVARRQQEQEALDEYSHGRGNRSYLREGMADGSYQAGMAAAKDQRTTAQKRIDKLLGVDSSQVTGEKTDWGKIAKGAWYKGADQFSTSMVGGLNWLFGDAAEQIHSLGIETINGIIGGVNSLTGANIKPVENKGNLLTNWYETLKETKAHNEKVFAANANSSKAAQIVDNFGTSFVAAVPMALEALMTAPYAAAKAGATATTAGLQYVSGLQAAKGMEAAGMMARQSASTLMQNPQFWSSYVQAIGDSAETAEESGMSPRDAAIYTMINSFFNAVIEVGGADETLGGIQNFPMRLRQLEEQGGKKAVVEWFKDSVLGEGLEEVAQGIFERGVKAPATGAKVASLDPGDTDAIFNPWTSAQEFTGGAVVGGLLGGGQTVIQGGAQKVSDNRAFKGDAQTLLDSAKQSGGEQYAAQIREIEQAAKGKDGSVKLNRGQARQLYDIIESSGAAEQYRETVNQKATAQSAEGLVSSVFADGDIELTDQQRGRIMETMSEGSAGIADFAMGTREAYEMGERGATMEETVQAMGEKYGLTPKQARTAWGFGASENSTAESAVRARTSARERAQNVGSWATVQEYAVSQFGEHADRVVEIHGMNPKQNLQEFTRGMDEVSSLGRVNPNQEDAIEYGARYGLTEEQSAAAWQLGRDQSAKERTEAPAEAIKATARIRVSKNGRGTVRGLASSEDGAAPAAADKSKNGRVIGENVRFSELNDAQKAAVRLFRMFAEATGINFRLTNETRDDGRTVTTANGETRHVFSGSQGEFSRTNAPDEITVDIGAGLYFTEDAETEEHYTMLRTLGHELVHFIQAWSPAQYAELRDSVFRYVRENGTSGKSINDRIDEVRSRHPEWSYERASDEVVAEALSEALPESQFAEQLARENKGLAEKIREALRDFVRDLKAAFARYAKRVGHVSDDLREQYKGELRYAESILKVYDNALSSAVRNYQEATEGTKTAQKASESEGAETGEKSKGTSEAAEGGTEVKNNVEQRQAALNERIRGAEEAEANALPLEETAEAPEETEATQESDREDARGYTNAELLELAADEIKTGDMNEAEKYALDTFKKHLGQLNALRAERTAALSAWQNLRDAGDTQRAAAKAARDKLDILNGKIRAEREAVAKVSEAKPLERVLKQARKFVEEGDRAEARERIANYRDGKRRSTMRQKIRAVRDTLDAILRHPKKGNSLHVPPELVRAVSEVCSLYAENRRSTYTARAEKYGKAAESSEAGSAAEAEARASEARASAQGEKLDVLIAAYEALQKSDKYSATFSPTVLKILETLRSELRGTEIQNMTLDQLTEVYNAMTALKKTVIEANKAYSINRQKSITETANQTKSEILNTPVTDKKLRVFIRRVGLWQMRPDTFFSAICGYAKDNGGEAIQRGFTEGTERSLTIQRDFYNLMRPVLETESASERQELKQLITNPTAKKNLVKWGLRDRNGDEVLTTRGMMLQAYKLMKQEDSRRSLALGGFSLPDLQTYYSGKTTDAYGDRDLGKMRTETVFEAYSNLLHEAKRIKTEAKAETSTEAKAEAERESKRLLQEADTLLKSAETKVNDMMKQIERQLTPFEKKLLELAEKWYEYSGKKMDEVFFEMYGYHLPRVENYTAIHRDTTTIGLDVRGFNFDEINLENSGFVKERVKSNAPILLTDIFNELQTSAVKVGRYYGYALVQRDFNKIYRAKLPGGYSLEEVVASRWGVGGKNIPSGAQWIKNYIGAVSGANNADGSILDFLYGAGASSSLSLNLRVAVSQLASIPTAAGVIGWKDMAAGFPGGLKTALTAKGRTELAQKSVWFWQRYRGSGGLTEIADFKSGTGMGPVGRLWGRVAQSRAGKYLFNWCQAMDVLATGSMWSMAERHVQSQGLTPQSESYEQAVADCYRDIIRKTQPNYTETERSDILRDRRTGMKFLTMYKTQSNQNLNILMEANGRLRKYSQDYKAHRGGVTAKDLAEARTAFVNSFTAVLMGGSVSFALFRTAVNFILGTLKKYRDEDDELTAESVLLGILDETLSSMAGMFAFGNIVYDAVSAIVTGGRFYGLSDSAFETLGNALTSGVSAIQKLFDEDADAESKAKAIAKALMSGLQLFGAPINNALKIADAGKMWYTDLANGTFGQFEGNVEHSKTDEYRRIIRATREGDSEKAARIIASLLLESEAVTDREAEKEMQSGIRAQLKKMFLANDSELTAEEAESLLAALCGHRKREAQEMVTEWRGKAETGYTYDEIREAYVAGSVEESTVREYMTTYKGFSASKADETMQKMRCQKETGYKYDDLKDAFLDEKITASQARSWLMHYGGRSTESAADTVSDWTAESRYGYSSSNWRDAFDGKERDSDTLDALMQSYGSTWMHDAYAGLRAYGMAPKNCYDTLEGMDTSQNGSITQSECYQYLTANYSYAEAVRIWDVMARAKNWQSKGNFRTFQWAGEQWLKAWQFQ